MANRKLGCLSIFLFVALCASVFVNFLLAATAFHRMSVGSWDQEPTPRFREVVCHGELVRTKPHPRYLTGFYVAVSFGGVCGGLFVGLLAPSIFHAYDEFPIGLALCGLLVFRVL